MLLLWPCWLLIDTLHDALWWVWAYGRLFYLVDSDLFGLCSILIDFSGSSNIGPLKLNSVNNKVNALIRPNLRTCLLSVVIAAVTRLVALVASVC